jgi:hypothetical protein
MKNELIIKVRWSKKKVKAGNPAHVIFEIKNNTGSVIALVGYKMVNKKKKDFSVLKNMNWETDNHFQILLWHRDKHEFHWNDVNVATYYGLSKGVWNTRVIIGYIVQGTSDIKASNHADATIEIV